MIRRSSLALCVLLGAAGCTQVAERDPHGPDELPRLLTAAEQRLGADPAAAPAGDRAAVLAELDTILAAQPANRAVLQRRARLRLADGQPRAALEDLGRLEEYYGPEPDVLVVRGRCWRALGYRQRAATAFTAALDLDKHNIGALRGLGLLLAEEGRDPAARRYLERCLELAPGDAAAERALVRMQALAGAEPVRSTDPIERKQLGLLAVARGEHQRGTDLLLRAMRSRPDDVEILCGAARGFAARGMDAEAIELLEHALRVAPEHRLAHEQLGAAWFRRSAEEPALAARAAKHFARAAELDPSDARMHHAAARAWARAGSLGSAQGHYLAAMEAGEADAMLHNDLGLLMLEADDVAAAIIAFERGLLQSPDDQRLLANLMLARYRAGQSAAAVELRDRLTARDDLDDAVRGLLARYGGGEEAP